MLIKSLLQLQHRYVLLSIHNIYLPYCHVVLILNDDVGSIMLYVHDKTKFEFYSYFIYSYFMTSLSAAKINMY